MQFLELFNLKLIYLLKPLMSEGKIMNLSVENRELTREYTGQFTLWVNCPVIPTVMQQELP